MLKHKYVSWTLVITFDLPFNPFARPNNHFCIFCLLTQQIRSDLALNSGAGPLGPLKTVAPLGWSDQHVSVGVALLQEGLHAYFALIMLQIVQFLQR